MEFGNNQFGYFLPVELAKLKNRIDSFIDDRLYRSQLNDPQPDSSPSQSSIRLALGLRVDDSVLFVFGEQLLSFSDKKLSYRMGAV